MANCDPSFLANAARCFQSCVPTGLRRSLKTYLLCQYSNLPTGPVFDPDAAAFFARAVILTDAQKQAVNTLVVSLKAANLWTKADFIYPFVGGTAATHALNLKSTLFTITWFGSLLAAGAHTASGATGDGATGYGDTGYNPSIGVVNWNVNSATLSGYSVTANPASGHIISVDNGPDAAWIAMTNGANVFGHANNDNTPLVLVELGPYKGVLTMTRSAAAARKIYFGPVDNASDAKAAQSLPNNDLYIFARNNLPLPGSFWNGTLGFGYGGGGFSDADASALNTIVTTYETSLGR